MSTNHISKECNALSTLTNIDRPNRSLTRRQLERAAIGAHAAGTTWHDFWRQYGPHAIALEPYDRHRFRRLIRRLTALVAAGDTDGSEPIDAGFNVPMQWELDDAASHTTR